MIFNGIGHGASEVELLLHFFNIIKKGGWSILHCLYEDHNYFEYII